MSEKGREYEQRVFEASTSKEIQSERERVKEDEIFDKTLKQSKEDMQKGKQSYSKKSKKRNSRLREQNPRKEKTVKKS